MSLNLFTAHQQWAVRPPDERYTTLGTLQEAVNDRRNLSKTTHVGIADIHAEPREDGQALGLLTGLNDKPKLPTHWAFGQLAKVIHAPAAYLRTLPTELTARCINEGLKRVHDNQEVEQLKLLSHLPHEGGTSIAQAFTSLSYGRVWDADVVEAVRKVVAVTGGRFHNPKEWNGTPGGLYASDRDCFMFLIDGGSYVDGGGDRDVLHRGFIVWNSEVGKSSLGITTFLFRGVCGNHIIYGAEDVNTVIVRHTLGGPRRFAEEVTPHLLDYVNQSTRPMEAAIARAKLHRLPAAAEERLAFVRKHDLTKGELEDAEDYALREEGKFDTLWDLVNGGTASARDLAWIDARLDREKKFSNLLKLVAD